MERTMKVTNTQLRNLILLETRRALSEGRKVSESDSFAKDVASEVISYWDRGDSAVEDFFVGEVMAVASTLLEGYEEKDQLKIFRKLDERPEAVAHSVVKELMSSKYLKEMLYRYVSAGLEDAFQDFEGMSNFRGSRSPESRLKSNDMKAIARDISDTTGKNVSWKDLDVVDDPVYKTVFAVKDEASGKTYIYDIESGSVKPKKFKTWPPKARQ